MKTPSLKLLLSRSTGCLAQLSVATLLLAQVGAALAAPPSANAPPPGRFLFLVDTSFSMRGRAPGLLQSVQALLESDLGGRLRTGDTLGLWTFNEDVYSGRFPLQQWSPATRQTVVDNLVGFLQSQRFEKKTDLAKVLAKAFLLARDSPVITFVLLTDGDEPVRGTPFDDTINAGFREQRREQARRKQPLALVVRAEQGRFVNQALGLPPWPVEVPATPMEIARAEAEKHPRPTEADLRAALDAALAGKPAPQPPPAKPPAPATSKVLEVPKPAPAGPAKPATVESPRPKTVVIEVKPAPPKPAEAAAKSPEPAPAGPTPRAEKPTIPVAASIPQAAPTQSSETPSAPAAPARAPSDAGKVLEAAQPPPPLVEVAKQPVAETPIVKLSAAQPAPPPPKVEPAIPKTTETPVATVLERSPAPPKLEPAPVATQPPPLGTKPVPQMASAISTPPAGPKPAPVTPATPSRPSPADTKPEPAQPSSPSEAAQLTAMTPTPPAAEPAQATASAGPLPVQGGVLVTQPFLSGPRLLGLGVLLLGVAGVLLWLLIRPARTTPPAGSLITQSLDRDKKSR